jgi:hypothetical protein
MAYKHYRWDKVILRFFLQGYNNWRSSLGSIALDPRNDNMRHATTCHETGHAQSIGHIWSEINELRLWAITPIRVFTSLHSL